ncbi:ketoacyl-synthetase C-terminal extension domain-containing protein [Streptomyces sp. M10(2022)]
MENGTIPASLHSSELTSAIDWEKVPVEVPQATRPWPQDERPGLAGVSSFGISGTNAHIVLGAYRPLRSRLRPRMRRRARRTRRSHTRRPRLLTLSSHQPETLRDVVESYVRHLEPGGAGSELPLRDVAFSAATRREHRESRLTVVGKSHRDVVGKLGAFLDGEATALLRSADDVYERRAQVVFVFRDKARSGSAWDVNSCVRKRISGAPWRSVTRRSVPRPVGP